MPGPTVSGGRTATWKKQVGHGFRRAQPVYLLSPGRYALATVATGYDGVVGDIGSDRFELVTGGELDNVSVTPKTIYSLGTIPGVAVADATYPIYKALAADSVALVVANVGTAGVELVLPYTFTVTPLGGAVPIAQGDGTLDPGWIPDLDYEVLGAVADHNDHFKAHSPYLVRAPEGGGILDTTQGSLVFDVDSVTQVIDEDFI